MNILLLEKYPEIKKEYLNYINTKHKIFELENDFSTNQIDAIMIRSTIVVDNNLINKYLVLKYIFRVGVGLDNIDLNLCKEKNIKVINTPGVSSDSVADLVIAGILNIKRNLLKINKDNFLNRFEFIGEEISGKKVAIVGFGAIGKKVYNRLKSFGVKSFLIYDPFLTEEYILSFDYCQKTSKKDFFNNVDIVSLHLPLNSHTKNFIDKKEFDFMKKNVLIINVSRSGIINQKELIKFLYTNKKSGYFADVWEGEIKGELPNKDLFNLDNVYITPHIGAMTQEAEKRMHFFDILK